MTHMLTKFDPLFANEPTGLPAHPAGRPFSTGKVPVPFLFSPRSNRWLKNTLSRSAGPTGRPGFTQLLYTQVEH